MFNSVRNMLGLGENVQSSSTINSDNSSNNNMSDFLVKPEDIKPTKTVPEEFLVALQNVLDNYESQTGCKAELTFQIYGNNDKLVLGEFEKRTGIKVTEMKKGLEGLIGNYETFDDIKKKAKMICAEQFNTNLFYDTNNVLIGTCRHCGKTSRVASYSYCSCGSNNNRCIYSELDSLYIGYHNGVLYYSTGGSIGLLRPIGKFEFIN